MYSSSIDGLKHFWRFENQTLTDSIGDNTLVVRRAIETTYAYNYDHNYERDGSLRMNDGYLTFPEDVYFNSSFTISVWVRPSNDNDKYTRIVEFGNDKNSDNIILMLNDAQTSYNYPRLYVFYGSSQFYVKSPVSLDPYNFAFLAVTYTAEYAKIYINGNLVGN